MMLYVGPDQVIPLSGFIGTAIGLALIFWGKVAQFFRMIFARFGFRSSEAEKTHS
jgi:hypothetical protein